MVQDAVLILEDSDEVIEGFKQQFEDFELPIELLYAKTYKEYVAHIEDEVTNARVKCVVMDLSNNQTEDEAMVFESVKYIKQQYLENRIPIFIHSGYLTHYNELDDQGTVYKVEKRKGSIKEIVEQVKLMHDSGFLDIFCKSGRLESEIMKQIHSAFTSQFKGNEIAAIIESIRSVGSDNLRDRTAEVFERIALRAVYQNTISNIINNEPVKVNSIEHYYRRTNREARQFWTGDIFETVATEAKPAELIVVVTPRCNAARGNYDQILACKVRSLNEDEIRGFVNPNKDKLRKGITDDSVGERLRFLPKTPQFSGGFVDFVHCYSFPPDQLKNFTYKVSMVDDLTNDVVRKLAAYLLRGGISDTAYQEAHYYFKEVEAQNEEGGEAAAK